MNDALKKIIRNLAAFVIVCVLLLVGLRIWLTFYTHHRSSIELPDLSGLSLDSVGVVLAEEGLRFEVVDSFYREGLDPGVVLEQRPAAGAKVKVNRIIFLTTNAHERESIPMPYVKDLSQRQAIAMLEGAGFKVRKVSFVTSQYKNLVIDVQYKGKSLRPGESLPKGSGLTLVVGQGDHAEYVIVPNLKGLNLDEAVNKAHSNNLNIGDIIYDEKPRNDKDAAKYIIYDQLPRSGNATSMSSHIKIWMSKNPGGEPEEIIGNE